MPRKASPSSTAPTSSQSSNAPSGPPPGAPSAPPPGAPSGPPPGAPSGPPPTQPASNAAQILKIGMVSDMSSVISLDWMHETELMADMDNQKGGLDIGGQKYQVQIIEYDKKNSQATEVAATNRLVYQDKVQFIIHQGTFESAWLPATESNEILIFNTNMNAMFSMVPSLKYSFNGTGQQTALEPKLDGFVTILGIRKTV